MDKKAKIITVAGKGGVGKTSISASIVRLLVEKYPDKKILAIDADPAVGLSVALGVDVKLTLDDIDLGDVSKSDLGAAGEAVFALASPGIVGPFMSDLGPALFRMNAVLAAQNTTFDAAKPAHHPVH